MLPFANITAETVGSEVFDMKTRVIVALVLLPLLLVVLLVLPKVVTAILLAVMAAIAAYELLSGTGLVKHPRLCIYAMVSALWCTLWCGLHIGYAWLLLGILLYWCALFAEMMFSGGKLGVDKIAVCFLAGVIIPLLFASIVRIQITEKGRVLALLPFAIAFLSDSGAYFAGLKFGKHKLAPTISPKKTVEGVLGGIVATVFGMIVFSLIMDVFLGMEVNYLAAFVYGIAGSVAGVFGDLCFSVIKRQTGIKDYGNLIPGHGGILDRFDSMMVVGPLTEILLLLLPLAV